MISILSRLGKNGSGRSGHEFILGLKSKQWLIHDPLIRGNTMRCLGYDL